MKGPSTDQDASDSDEGSKMLKFDTSDVDFKYRHCDFCEIQVRCYDVCITTTTVITFNDDVLFLS